MSANYAIWSKRTKTWVSCSNSFNGWDQSPLTFATRTEACEARDDMAMKCYRKDYEVKKYKEDACKD